jgi:peptidoglycan/xylan/chitin deacetylase (PgdA/CDA1 family)
MLQERMIKAAKGIAKGLARSLGYNRADVAAARMYCERYALAMTSRSRKRDRGRILCYHSVGQPSMGVNDVTPQRFKRHIELALDAGYRFVPASKLATGGGNKNELAITFDDGLVSVKEKAAPILKEFDIPWSVFVVSEWAEHTQPWTEGFVLPWSELEELASGGAEIGSHSRTHPDFAKIGRAQMIDELQGSRQMFEQRLGFLPSQFAIPYGQSMNWPQVAGEVAKEAGYELFYAQAEATRPPGTIPRTFVTKFDHDLIFKALLQGAYDRWEEWY